MVKDTELAVVECGGVGYACRTTLSTLSQLQAVGNDVMLYTYLHVREDNIELFGFASQQELNCFKMLISVSGVGPKAALSILSDVTPEKFALLVASEDSKTLTRTKGIGAKTAQRIVLELKDKIVKENQEVDKVLYLKMIKLFSNPENCIGRIICQRGIFSVARTRIYPV